MKTRGEEEVDEVGWIDCRSEATGLLHTENYKSQQQTQTDKNRTVAMKETAFRPSTWSER